MQLSVRMALYTGILEEKWVDVDYVNSKNEHTSFYIGIKDVDMEKGRVACEIFNHYKSMEVLRKEGDAFIFISGIKRAKPVPNSYFPSPKTLVLRLEKDKAFAHYLEADKVENDILRYYSDCYVYDNDPYVKESIMLPGVDLFEFAKKRKKILSKEDFSLLLDTVFKNIRNVERSSRVHDLVINDLSIDIGGKQYVVLFHKVTLNFKTRAIYCREELSINKTFLFDIDRKVSLSAYIDSSAEEYLSLVKEDREEAIALLRENLHDGDMINTRPNIFLLERSNNRGVSAAIDAIREMDEKGELTFPLKSFFGRNRSKPNVKKQPEIIIYRKCNIDQLRVVYNAMISHVTFVKGPPGTGKTETIFNVILSAFCNGKTVLVCSNNNKPINDIFQKMRTSLVGKDGRFIPFPIIRLGNNFEMKETLLRLQKITAYLKEKESEVYEEKSAKGLLQTSITSYDGLKELIARYEERQEHLATLEKLKRIRSLSTSKAIQEEVDKQLQCQSHYLEEFSPVTASEFDGCVLPACENVSFMEYLYESSLLHLRKLLSDKMRPLLEILKCEITDDSVVSFNKILKEDGFLQAFLNVFPVILCTNLSCEKLGEAKPQFDLCIMDEAGQCNVASSLIPIVRAKDLLLVGDTDQLQPVTVIEPEVNDYLKEKYHIKGEYDYTTNSILSTMAAKDGVSKNIWLRYHYRCGRKIAGYVNHRFYAEKLKLLNEKEGSLLYVKTSNRVKAGTRNASLEEAQAIVSVLKEGKYRDVGIVTPFVNQARLINEILSQNGIKDISAGTVHTLQGSEKSTIIMSPALSLKTAKRTMAWIKDNHELINVAVTRAKDTFIFVGDKEAIDALNGGEDSDIKTLSDYVYSGGTVVVPSSPTVTFKDYSNASESEREFLITVSPYFEGRKSKLRIEQNLLLKEAIRGMDREDIRKYGNRAPDFVVQVKEKFFRGFKTIVAFELDGGEHIGDGAVAARDREKETILRKYGVKLIRIANSQVKDYETIIRLFEVIAKGLSDMESEAQLSLFELDEVEASSPIGQ